MQKLKKIYNYNFYNIIQAGSSSSAAQVVPLVMEYIKPISVVDIGCGTGEWSHEFLKFGVDIIGVDGVYIPGKYLKIPKEIFLPQDLNEPLNINRLFDLVISLEVAEHLRPERAESFVGDLTRLAPVILFSAAIPGQGGNHHLNEQWPSYWINHFTRYDYVAIDLLRSLIWDNNKIEWWYRQNLLIFVKKSAIENYPLLKAGLKEKIGFVDLVHPENYLPLSGSMRKLIKKILFKLSRLLS